LDLRKPIGRFVTISREGQREFFKVQYEKMSRFCGACGLVGDTHLECGSGEHEENSLKWGDYLKAERETWHGRFAFGGNRGGARGGRGRNSFGRGTTDPFGQGGGVNQRDHMHGGVMPQPGRGVAAPAGIAWRHNAIAVIKDASLDDSLKDTASSPIKQNDIEMSDNTTTDLNAKRQLEFPSENSDANILDKGVTGVGSTAMVTDEMAVPTNVLENKSENDRKKRSKKDGADSPSLGSAGSLEEPARSQ
jgi:hypothetical protein